jgi:voltage-gated potassium channel
MTQERWQKLIQWPLIAASIVFLVAYAWTEIAQLKESADDFAEAVMWAVWSLFVVDYVANLVLAKRRWRWFYRHLLDLAIVVLPVFRPLRLLRLISLATVFHRFMGGAARGRVAVYAISYGSVLVLMASLAVLGAERDASGSKIKNFGDALWWACETITTVGYGDMYPVTLEGRVIAVVLMVASLGIIGTVAATLSSWLVEHVAARDQLEQRVTRCHIEEVLTELEQLKGMMAAAQVRGEDPKPS